MGTRGRVRTKELHAALFGVEGPEGIGHEFVGDVPIEIDDEAIVAEAAVLGGPREEVVHVDSSSGELLQDRDEAAGFVGALVHHDPRAVVPTRCRHRTASDHHEPRLIAVVVLDVLGEHVEAVERGGVLRSNRGLMLGLRFTDCFGGISRAVGSAHFGVRNIFAQVAMALSGSHRDGEDFGDVAELHTGQSEQAVFDVEHDLALYEKVVVEGQRVLGEVDRSLDGVLDGHHAYIHGAFGHRVEDVGHRAIGDEFAGREIGLGTNRLLGERAEWAEEAHAGRPSGVASGGHDLKATAQRSACKHE